MSPSSILFTAELLLVGFGVGATVWFFLVQTPALLWGLGMARFIPLQMRLVRVFARALAVASVGTLGLALARVGLDGPVLPAAIAATAAVLNAWVVVPRALRSGGQALRDVRAGEGEDAGLGSFTSVGGGPATKVWHRVVVVAVLVMTGGLLADGVDLIHHGRGAAAGSADHRHGAGAVSHEEAVVSHPADPMTVENIRALHGMVSALRERGSGSPLAPEDTASLRDAYLTVFRDCTMTGPAHDALHDLLVPVDGLLERVADPAQTDAALAALDARLAGFDEQFHVEE